MSDMVSRCLRDIPLPDHLSEDEKWLLKQDYKQVQLSGLPRMMCLLTDNRRIWKIIFDGGSSRTNRSSCFGGSVTTPQGEKAASRNIAVFDILASMCSC